MLVNKKSSQVRSHLSQALFAEGTLGHVVQAALQTVFTEGVAARCSHRLIEQPVSITKKTEVFILNAH